MKNIEHIGWYSLAILVPACIVMTIILGMAKNV